MSHVSDDIRFSGIEIGDPSLFGGSIPSSNFLIE